MKILAAHRLRAMRIKQGNNFRGGEISTRDYLYKFAGLYDLLNYHEDKALLKYVGADTTTYLLATIPNIDWFKTAHADEDLEDTGATAIDAFIGVYFTGEIDRVWVAKDLRGKGFGKALYNVAHTYSKTGLFSSDNMGTLSLSVWLSLYKAVPSISIEVANGGDFKAVPRKAIKISDLDISADNVLLTDRKGPEFRFVWPK